MAAETLRTRRGGRRTSATEGTTAAAPVCKFVVDMMVVDSKFMDFAIDADSYADILQDWVV